MKGFALLFVFLIAIFLGGFVGQFGMSGLMMNAPFSAMPVDWQRNLKSVGFIGGFWGTMLGFYYWLECRGLK